MKLYYINAIAGSGKTTALINHLIGNQNKNFVLLQPTKDLIDQTLKNLQDRGYPSKKMQKIVSEQGQGSVFSRLHRALSNPVECKLIIATFEGWKRIKRKNLKCWHLIIDEAPDVFTTTTLYNLSHLITLSDLTRREINDTYSYLDIPNKKTEDLRTFIASNSNNMNNIQTDTIKKMLQPYQTIVKTSDFEKLSKRKVTDIDVFHILKPGLINGFASAIIMSAQFTDTPTYMIWSAMGLKFKRERNFEDQFPLTEKHDEKLCEKIEIHYLIDDWSSYKKNNHSRDMEREFNRACREVFAGEEFIYTANKKDSRGLLNGVNNHYYVNPKAFGINDYRHINHSAIYAHFNLSTAAVSMLKSVFGIRKEACDLLNKSIYYQFVCRTSIRNQSSPFEKIPVKKIVVMDKDMAEHLHQVFYGSSLIKFESSIIDGLLDSKRGRKPLNGKAMTSSERQKNFKAKKRQEADLNRLDEFDNKLKLIQLEPSSGKPEQGSGLRPDDKFLSKNGNEISIKENQIDFGGGGGWPILITAKYNSKENTKIDFLSWNHVIDFLTDRARTKVSSKHKNNLFCVARFTEKDGIIINRQNDNLIKSYALLLDMDSKENICPKEFSELFSGLSMFIYHSFSSKPDQRRWRVVIPFARPIEESTHNAIAKDLLAIAKNHGFEFDRKIRGNDIMYLPCIPPEYPFEPVHLFIDGRKPFPIDEWLRL